MGGRRTDANGQWEGFISFSMESWRSIEAMALETGVADIEDYMNMQGESVTAHELVHAVLAMDPNILAVELKEQKKVGRCYRMRNKVPIGMILQRIVEEGDEKGLDVLVGEMVHLPRAREFAAVTDMMAKVFRTNRALGEDESLMLHAHRLASMGKRLFRDRQNLKPVLEGVRNVLAEWKAWVDDDDPTEEEIQAHLERVAGTMALLDEAMSAYDDFVLTKLKEGRGME
jgi:hypothetical protein